MNLGTTSKRPDPRVKYNSTLGKLHKEGRGQENCNIKTILLHKNLGSTLNCTHILVPQVRDLTPGKNTTCPGANHISKEEAKKIAIRKQ
jgi:hypothetical protein